MKILLINPPPVEGLNVIREGRCMQRTEAWTTVWSPVSLATIAAVLRNEGFEMRLHDGSVVPAIREEVIADIKEWAPDLVVVNTATTAIEQDLAFADLIGDTMPGVRVMLMGVHPSVFAQECFEMSHAPEMIVRGEP